jgi:uncharacterized membrane protein YfbV (UPF0208 family)
MLQKLKAAYQAFLATPLGHALEHAVTAAAVTAIGIYFTGHDAHAAAAAFVAGVVFGVRTALREYFKSPSDPTKRTRKA